MNQKEIEKSKKLAFIGMHIDPDFGYILQYKEALDLLYKSDKSIDTIVLPMMFLMRHYLELILKYNIKYFSKFSKSNNMIGTLDNTHKLISLANAFQEHWKIVAKKYNLKIDDKEYMEKFKILISLIAELDNSSMSFRYAHDKNKNRYFENSKTLDVYSIKILLEEVSPFLEYTTELFHEQVEQYIELEQEILSEYP